MNTEAELTEKTFRAWVRTHGLFRQEMETYFHAHGLSGAQWGVLRTLHKAEAEGDAGIPLGELGKRMIVKAPSISGVIDRLERQGFVERLPAPHDLRSKLVSLTPAGRDHLRSVLLKHPAQMEKILSPLTPAERADLLKLLSRIETHLAHLDPTLSKNSRS